MCCTPICVEQLNVGNLRDVRILLTKHGMDSLVNPKDDHFLHFMELVKLNFLKYGETLQPFTVTDDELLDFLQFDTVDFFSDDVFFPLLSHALLENIPHLELVLLSLEDTLLPLLKKALLEKIEEERSEIEKDILKPVKMKINQIMIEPEPELDCYRRWIKKTDEVILLTDKARSMINNILMNLTDKESLLELLEEVLTSWLTPVSVLMNESLNWNGGTLVAEGINAYIHRFNATIINHIPMLKFHLLVGLIDWPSKSLLKKMIRDCIAPRLFYRHYSVFVWEGPIAPLSDIQKELYQQLKNFIARVQSKVPFIEWDWQIRKKEFVESVEAIAMASPVQWTVTIDEDDQDFFYLVSLGADEVPFTIHVDFNSGAFWITSKCTRGLEETVGTENWNEDVVALLRKEVAEGGYVKRIINKKPFFSPCMVIKDGPSIHEYRYNWEYYEVTWSSLQLNNMDCILIDKIWIFITFAEIMTGKVKDEEIANLAKIVDFGLLLWLTEYVRECCWAVDIRKIIKRHGEHDDEDDDACYANDYNYIVFIESSGNRIIFTRDGRHIVFGGDVDLGKNEPLFLFPEFVIMDFPSHHPDCCCAEVIEMRNQDLVESEAWPQSEIEEGNDDQWEQFWEKIWKFGATSLVEHHGEFLEWGLTPEEIQSHLLMKNDEMFHQWMKLQKLLEEMDLQARKTPETTSSSSLRMGDRCLYCKSSS